MPWPRKHHFLFWVFFLLLLVGSVDFLIQRILAQETQLRWQKDLQARISHIRSRLEWSITGNLALARGLAAYISVNPDLSEAEFQDFGSEINRHSHRFRNIVAAPDYIIRYVYPPRDKSALIGVDYRDLPEQWPLARMARENDSLVVAGPLPLVQGGRGIIGRVPVFTGHEDSRRFWGIVSSVIQFEELMAEIRELARQLEIEIALTRNNNRAHTFYGDASLFESSQTMTQNVRLPGSNWVLGARMPSGASMKHPLSNAIHGGAVLAALLLCGLLLVVIRKNEALDTGEKRLQETNDQLEAFFGQSLDGFFFMMLDEPLDWNKVTDKEAEIERIYANQRITKFNQAILDQYGAQETDIRQRSPRDFFPEDPETGKQLWRQLFDTGRLHMEFREKRYDGRTILMEGDYLCLRNNKGEITGTFGVKRDVTATREAERQLERYIAIVDEHVLISQTDLAGNITYASKAFCRVSGYAHDVLIGRNHNIVRHPDMEGSTFKDLWQTIKAGKTWHGEVKNRKKNGGFFWADSTVSPLKDNTGRIYGYMAVRQDITDRKRIEEISITDRLTGIYNRVRLDEVLKNEHERFKRYGDSFSVILFDIDHFKYINDTHGHLVGDKALKEIAQLTRRMVRATDVPGRWGGEEFLIVSPHSDQEGAKQLAEKLRLAIAEHDFGRAARITASFGVATVDAQTTPDSLLKAVDDALYHAKENGRNRVSVTPRKGVSPGES
ncbi:MAG: diguanylate cyclase [Geoalkalibacter sp.]|jgi:diguanylate cyclase (GGDEF)-like protein/PAS domain S-box-containing protein|uniref:sensor domain-containing diguanylate cyclase n=1 Tax=Geoalkalibacter sp. TaxID=3041440 RepID=UPI002A9BF3B3|nr:diguanylate cyclase [Thermodesulfobacteriota bacterium]